MEKTQRTNAYASVRRPMSTTRGLIVLEGVFQLLLGLFFLTSPGLTTVSLIQFLGLYLLIRGIIHIVQIFTQKSSLSWGWLLFAGILGIISGLLILQHPLISTFITLQLTFYFILFTGFAQGLIGIAQGINGEGFWSILLGLVVVAICLYLMFNPFAAGLVIPWVLGLILLLSGIASLVFASFFKKD